MARSHDDDASADAPGAHGRQVLADVGSGDRAAGRENTQCIWVRLGNTTEIKVHQMHNVLSDGSHHLIVYKDDMDTIEQTDADRRASRSPARSTRPA